MARGDHIRVRRHGYWHHGIDCGDGTVIHYAGGPLDWRNAAVKRTPLSEFARDVPVEIVSPDCGEDPESVIRRAESRLGESLYGLLRNNCEHFARWCRTGLQESKQVQRFLIAAGATVLTVGVVLTSATVSVLLSRRGRLGRG